MGGLATGRCGGHAQASRQAKHCAHRGIITLLSCDKAFQDPGHSETREQKYVQQHIRICTHGVKTGVRASQDNRHSVPTHVPIPVPTLSVAGRGGGSNTTHALLSLDPETPPIGDGCPAQPQASSWEPRGSKANRQWLPTLLQQQVPINFWAGDKAPPLSPRSW